MKLEAPRCATSHDRKVLYVTPQLIQERKAFRSEMKAREEFARMPDEKRNAITRLLVAMFPKEAWDLGLTREELDPMYSENGDPTIA